MVDNEHCMTLPCLHSQELHGARVALKQQQAAHEQDACWAETVSVGVKSSSSWMKRHQKEGRNCIIIVRNALQVLRLEHVSYCKYIIAHLEHITAIIT
jgi:ABC-type cobalamin/Fe3+-siderophores transport system ATPase subunit